MDKSQIGMICKSPSIRAETQEAALRKAGAEWIVSLGRVTPKSWRDVVNAVREGDTVYIYGLALVPTPRGEDDLKPTDQVREFLIEVHERGGTVVEVSTGRNSRKPAERRAMTADAVKGLKRGNRSPATGRGRGRPAVEWTDKEIEKAKTVWFSPDYATNVIAEKHLPSKIWNGKQETFNAKRAWNKWGPSGRPYKKPKKR